MTDVEFSVVFSELNEEQGMKLSKLMRLMSEEGMLPKMKSITVREKRRML